MIDFQRGISCGDGVSNVIAHLPPLMEKAMFINVILAGGILDAVQ